MTDEPLFATYASVGWPATWDVAATIAFARHVEETLARFPWARQPEIVGAEDEGSAILVYCDLKPATTVEEVINNIGTCLRVPMQSAME